MNLHDPELVCGIMLDEWLDFVAWSDVLAIADCGRSDTALARLAHPVWCLNDIEGRLYWTTGEVSAKNPDARLLHLMIEIAHRLEARVRDSQGSFYLAVDQRYRDPPEGRIEGQPRTVPRELHGIRRQQERPRSRPLTPSKPEPPSGSVSVQVLVAGSLICLVAATAILIQS